MLGDKPLRRGGRAKRIVGKLNVGLVDHYHAGTRIAQRRDKVERRHVTRGVFWRGHSCQVWQSDAKNAYSLKHGGQLSRIRPAPPNASR